MGRTNTRTANEARKMRRVIRNVLGYRPSQVSVRIDCYSMGSTIHVTVKTPEVDFEAVKSIAEKFARGSMSVDVDFSAECMVEMGGPYLQAVTQALALIPVDKLLETAGIKGTDMVLTRTGRTSVELFAPPAIERVFWNDNGDTNGDIAFAVARYMKG